MGKTFHYRNDENHRFHQKRLRQRQKRQKNGKSGFYRGMSLMASETVDVALWNNIRSRLSGDIQSRQLNGGAKPC